MRSKRSSFIQAALAAVVILALLSVAPMVGAARNTLDVARARNVVLDDGATINGVATSMPDGSLASGTFRTAGGGDRFALEVTCLDVEGSSAAVGTIVTASTNPGLPVGSSFGFILEDDPDQLINTSSADCSGSGPFLTRSVTSGNIKVVDIE